MANVAKPCRARASAISTTLAVTVSGLSETVPAKPPANAAAV
jgi:hypothetical protein